MSEPSADVDKDDGLIDIMALLGRATLDVIGLAGPYLALAVAQRALLNPDGHSHLHPGFNYDFGALKQEADQQENELADAFKSMFRATQEINFFGILASFVPFPFALIPTKRKRTVEASVRVMNRVGKGIIGKAKAAIAREANDGGEKAVTKSDVEGRDVISMLSALNIYRPFAHAYRRSADIALCSSQSGPTWRPTLRPRRS